MASLGIDSARAAGGVLTQPLTWQVPELLDGFERLKLKYLQESVLLDTEFVGAVLRTDAGRYRFTQGQGQPGQDQVAFRIRPPTGTEVVGLWHTHGGHGAARAIFSPQDAATVRATGLPFYLITPDGEVRVLRPEHLAERRRAPLRFGGSLLRLPHGSHPGEPFQAVGTGCGTV